MSAFLVAVFNDYATAVRVRTHLVADGFPTDRVELTADCDRGRAAFAPGNTPHDKFALYFRTLFTHDDEQKYPERLANCVDCGQAIIAIHPRGDVETDRACQIVDEAHPSEIMRHELEHQPLEFAAARRDHLWARHFWAENPGHADCIYCRLYDMFSRRARPPKRAMSA